MSSKLELALNHIATAQLRLIPFLDLARSLGVRKVEIRNDLPGVEIADGTQPATVRREAEARGIEILTINALYPFDVWTPERVERADYLAGYAAACGAKALVLCPLNTVEDARSPSERAADLRSALAGLKPILERHGIMGLVEPLGFPESALRTKRAAVDAIDELGAGDRFQILHDTFHHYLAGEKELFPERTGLVHISGVEDTSLAIDKTRDEHRVLVGPADLIDNIGQIRALHTGDYAGPFSLEPFSPAVHALADPAGAIRQSFEFIARQAAVA
jgi:2-keto-myo-inositol isomerase